MTELPKEAQDLLMKVQMQNQELQEIIMQKQNRGMQKMEIDEALKEIKDKTEIYKEIGGILVKTDKDKVQKELDEEKEMLVVREKQVNAKEEKLKSEMEVNQKKLMGFIQGANPAG
ncbi:MAG: prefoldin subunit beta [Candidatus Aenigmatarchaeota archaeon]|nr:MAG: prefoldin subunit beta [Candidatus Aenigmarchaeota archaeon]